VKIPSKLFLEVMEEALNGPPVRLELGSQAATLRQRFYRVRQSCWERGDTRFAFLKFRISGTELVISKHRDPALIERRLRLRILREAVAFARKQGVGLDRPSGEHAADPLVTKESPGGMN
jgi:hypothetical protein